jgi:hypothetical protein
MMVGSHTRWYIILVHFVWLCLNGYQMHAQLSSGVSMQDLLRMQSANKSEVADLSLKSFAFDSPVEPAEYYVGPGDGFALNIWSSAPVQHA